MEKELTPFTVELADVAKEINGNVVIEFHTLKTTLTQEVLNELRDHGSPTTIDACVIYALATSGKSEAEIIEYLKEAEEAGHGVKISFEALDGSELNITSKENNPLLDVFVQAAESQNA